MSGNRSKVTLDWIVTDERGVKDQPVRGLPVGDYLLVHPWNQGWRVSHRPTGREVAWAHGGDIARSIAERINSTLDPAFLESALDDAGVEQIIEAGRTARWAEAEEAIRV